jgi:hypothetical protein
MLAAKLLPSNLVLARLLGSLVDKLGFFLATLHAAISQFNYLCPNAPHFHLITTSVPLTAFPNAMLSDGKIVQDSCIPLLAAAMDFCSARCFCSSCLEPWISPLNAVHCHPYFSEKFHKLCSAVYRYVGPDTKTFVIDCEAVAYDRVKDKILPFQVRSLSFNVIPHFLFSFSFDARELLSEGERRFSRASYPEFRDWRHWSSCSLNIFRERFGHVLVGRRLHSGCRLVGRRMASCVPHV